MMRTKILAAALLASLAAVAAVSAAGAAPRGVVYSFVGKLSAAPSDGHLTIAVEAGSPVALRALLGHDETQTFSYGEKTRFVLWQDGVPKAATAGDLHGGDYVRVSIRGPRGLSLDRLEQTAAAAVGDQGTSFDRPGEPLFLFRGKITAVGSSSISVDLAGGNGPALRLLIGVSLSQTFTVGSSTVYLRAQGRTLPTEITKSDLEVGDAVAIRVRAAKGSTLTQIEARAAVNVTEFEKANPS